MMNESATSDTRRTRRADLRCRCDADSCSERLRRFILSATPGGIWSASPDSGRDDAMHQPSEKQLDERLAKANWLREVAALGFAAQRPVQSHAERQSRRQMERRCGMQSINPLPLGIKFEDLGTLGQHHWRRMVRGWNPIRRSVPADKGEAGTAGEEGKRLRRKCGKSNSQIARCQDFGELPCMALHFCLWASGRVTKLVRLTLMPAPANLVFQPCSRY